MGGGLVCSIGGGGLGPGKGSGLIHECKLLERETGQNHAVEIRRLMLGLAFVGLGLPLKF